MRYDPRDPDAVIDVLQRGAEANRGAPCRRGSLDVVDLRAHPAGAGTRAVLTGDLHDNPVHLDAALRLAGLERGAGDATEDEGGMGGVVERAAAHLTLHEVIHSDRLMNGLDFSYRLLVRVAELKGRFPLLVHTLLANHELAQIAGAGIVKDGLNVVDAFNDGVDYVFGGDAPAVTGAINDFIRSMPLGLRLRTDGGELLCTHSLPGPDLIDRFDPAILEREVDEADYAPRRGSAHLLVWGREHTADLLHALAARWGVVGFVLGHEKAEHGWFFREPNCLVLNSDHAQGQAAIVNSAGPGAGGATEDYWKSCLTALRAART